MKLNSNTKKVLLFAALLVIAYLASLLFGGKDSGTADSAGTTANLSVAVTEAAAGDTAGAPDTEAADPETETETQSETAAAEDGTETPEDTSIEQAGLTVEKDGEYTDKEHVALYLYLFGELPANYITKKEANELGWPDEGNLGTVAPGKSIGGDYFGNYEGLLPKKKGRKYTECDIDFKGKSRGAKRIIFSNDGLIFYTEDHYKSFREAVIREDSGRYEVYFEAY